MNKIYLSKNDLGNILEFVSAFPDFQGNIAITCESDSGIGSFINASIQTTINSQVVTVTKEIVGVESW